MHSSIGGGTVFWESCSARLAQRYDLRDTRVVSGDGAAWVRAGLGYFHRAEGQLDRFHLARALREVLLGREWRPAIALLV